jgi:malonate transporter and related proteins
LDILALILPVLGVVILGYVCVKAGVVQTTIAEPLVQFVYHVCLPALMFHIVAGDPIGSLLNWKFWIAFGGGSLLMLGLVVLVGWRRLGDTLGERAILAFSAVQTNTGFVALPILHVIFGAKGVPPAAIANIIIAAIMFPMLAVIMEETRRGQSGERKPVWRLARNVFFSPMVWPTALGFIFAAYAIPVPKPVNDFLVILGSALAPCALFAIGASVDLDQILHDGRRIVVLSAVKLIVLPLAVFATGLALGMEPFFIIAATVCASVPTAKNVYFMASEYQVGEKSAAAMISATTVAAIVTMTLWILLLAALYPSVFHGHE